MLTAKDVEFYKSEGYVVVRDVLTPVELERLRSGLARFLDGAGEVDRNDDVYDLEDSHTRATPRVRRIKAPHRLDPAFHDLIRSPKLLDLMRPLLGASIQLQNSKLNLKSAGYGAAVEWHQDWAYYPYTNDDVLAVGVLLDEFAEDNGAMMVIPRSHKGPIHDHHANGVVLRRHRSDDAGHRFRVGGAALRAGGLDNPASRRARSTARRSTARGARATSCCTRRPRAMLGPSSAAQPPSSTSRSSTRASSAASPRSSRAWLRCRSGSRCRSRPMRPRSTRRRRSSLIATSTSTTGRRRRRSAPSPLAASLRQPRLAQSTSDHRI